MAKKKVNTPKQSRTERSISVDKKWNDILVALPARVLNAEYNRRLARKQRVEKIPDHLLNAELDRRAEEAKHFVPLDL